MTPKLSRQAKASHDVKNKTPGKNAPTLRKIKSPKRRKVSADQGLTDDLTQDAQIVTKIKRGRPPTGKSAMKNKNSTISVDEVFEAAPAAAPNITLKGRQRRSKSDSNVVDEGFRAPKTDVQAPVAVRSSRRIRNKSSVIDQEEATSELFIKPTASSMRKQASFQVPDSPRANGRPILRSKRNLNIAHTTNDKFVLEGCSVQPRDLGQNSKISGTDIFVEQSAIENKENINVTSDAPDLSNLAINQGTFKSTFYLELKGSELKAAHEKSLKQSEETTEFIDDISLGLDEIMTEDESSECSTLTGENNVETQNRVCIFDTFNIRDASKFEMPEKSSNLSRDICKTVSNNKNNSESCDHTFDILNKGVTASSETPEESLCVNVSAGEGKNASYIINKTTKTDGTFDISNKSAGPSSEPVEQENSCSKVSAAKVEIRRRTYEIEKQSSPKLISGIVLDTEKRDGTFDVSKKDTTQTLITASANFVNSTYDIELGHDSQLEDDDNTLTTEVIMNASGVFVQDNTFTVELPDKRGSTDRLIELTKSPKTPSRRTANKVRDVTRNIEIEKRQLVRSPKSTPYRIVRSGFRSSVIVIEDTPPQIKDSLLLRRGISKKVTSTPQPLSKYTPDITPNVTMFSNVIKTRIQSEMNLTANASQPTKRTKHRRSISLAAEQDGAEGRRNKVQFCSPNNVPGTSTMVSVYRKTPGADRSILKNSCRKRSMTVDDGDLSPNRSRRMNASIKTVDKPSFRIKMPDFASMHKKQFNQMESVVEHKVRVENRHREMAKSTVVLPSSTVVLPSSNVVLPSSNVVLPSGSRKILRAESCTEAVATQTNELEVPEPHRSQPVHHLNTGLNRFGFKVSKTNPTEKNLALKGFNRFGFKVSNTNLAEKNLTLKKQTDNKLLEKQQRRVAALKRPEQDQDDRTYKNRVTLTGVRLNKRFDLLMQCRNKNN